MQKKKKNWHLSGKSAAVLRNCCGLDGERGASCWRRASNIIEIGLMVVVVVGGGLRFTHHIECEKEGECSHSRVSALRGNAGEKREGTDGKSKMTGWLRARHTGLECRYQFKQSCFLTFIYSCRRYRLLTCFFLMK